jgi:hypothetical protein
MSSWTCSRDSFVGPWLCSCDVSFGSSYVDPLRAYRRFVLIITPALFFELISHGMLFRGTQWLLFMNQILHLANPHDKLSAFCVSKSWVSKYLSTNPLGSKTWTSLSLFSYAGWRLWEGEHEIWWSRSFAWSDWDTDGSPYACSWRLIWRIVTSSLLYELSHTLRPYAYLKCEIAIVLTWSCSMYYNWSILYLASCVAWFVHRLWSALVRLCLLLARLDLFAACRVHR